MKKAISLTDEHKQLLMAQVDNVAREAATEVLDYYIKGNCAGRWAAELDVYYISPDESVEMTIETSIILDSRSDSYPMEVNANNFFSLYIGDEEIDSENSPFLRDYLFAITKKSTALIEDGDLFMERSYAHYETWRSEMVANNKKLVS